MYFSKHKIYQEINLELEKIWDDFLDFPECQFTPLTFELPQDINGNLIKDTIMFIGINPSFDTKNKNHPFFQYSNYKPGKRVDCASINFDYDTDDIPYFNAFRLIMRDLRDKYEIENAWGHIDLTFFRETNQKIVEKYFYNQDQSINSFIWRQVELALGILKHINPALIVVTNAFACKVLSTFNLGNLEKTFDKETCTYTLFDSTLLKASMLSGSRAMDVGSRERLIWHISQVLSV